MNEPEGSAPRPVYLLVLPWELSAAGGVTHVVTGLYDAIRSDARLVPTVLVLSWGASTPVASRDEGGRAVIHFRIRGLRSRGSLAMAILRYGFALPLQLWRLRRFVNQYGIQVVNSHYVGNSEITWALARRLGLYRGKLLFSVHGRDGRTLATLSGVRGRLWRWALSQADAVVACSQELAGEMRAAFHLPHGKVVAIHNGVDAEGLLALGGGQRRLKGRPALLSLGTFEHKKGHDLLLQAFPDILLQYPDAHLTIMGRRGETFEATQELVLQLGLEHRVSLAVDAPHDVALQALALADVFVLPSRNEAFAMVLLEAGALAIPIVATGVCGVRELIEDGVTGTVVEPENPRAIGAAVLRVLADPSQAAARAGQLQQVVRTRFTRAETSSAYLKLAGAG